MNILLHKMYLLLAFTFCISTIYGQTTRIKTRYSNDWDSWEISGDGFSLKAKTRYSEDWDNWEVFGDLSLRIRTRYSEDWDDWEISGDLSKLTPSAKATVMFIPIFVASIHQKGINK